MKEICKGCNEHKFIVNRKYMLCDDCNYFRMYGMTRLDAFKQKKSQNQYKLSPKRNKSVRTSNKRSDILLKDRETYYKVFLSKPNVCEECGVELPDMFVDDDENIVYIAQYSHILSKGAWPEFRHDERNFNRLCFNCHRRWEDGDRENMKINKTNQSIIQNLLNDRLSKSGK